MARENKTRASDLIKLLYNSILLLKENPKLFIPRLMTVIFWGTAMFLAGQHLQGLGDLSELQGLPLSEAREKLEIVKSLLLLLTAFLAIGLVVESAANGMFPFLVRQFYEREPLSLSDAFKASRKKITRLFSASLFLLAIALIFLTPLATLSSQDLITAGAVKPENVALTVIVFLALGVATFQVFNVLVLEEKPVLKSFSTSIKLGGAHFKATLFAVILTSAVSLGSAFMALFYGVPGLAGFVLLRGLTVITSTYSSVFSPAVYEEIIKRKRLK